MVDAKDAAGAVHKVVSAIRCKAASFAWTEERFFTELENAITRLFEDRKPPRGGSGSAGFADEFARTWRSGRR